MSDAHGGEGADRVEVVVIGPGHHDRAERAQPLIAAVAARGLDVVVVADLRPRLAADVRTLLDAGARMVRLESDGVVGDLASTAQPVPTGSVVVILRPGRRAQVEVHGGGPTAAVVRAAIADLVAADAGHD